MAAREVIEVSDSRIDLFQNPNAPDRDVSVLFKGAERITPTVANATTTGINSTQFQIFSPSLKSMISRDLRVQFDVQFQIVGDGSFVELWDAPRRLPINNACNTINLFINGSSASIQPYQIMSPLLEYENTPQYRSEQLSGSAAMPDQYANYNDWTVYGSNRSELATFGANTNEISRGGFDGGLRRHLSVDGKTANYTFTEPLFISGLSQKSGETCLSNINSLNITLQFVADIFNKMWSSASGLAGHPDPYLGSNVVVTFPNPARILYDVLTPDPRSTSQISQSLTYPYTFFQPYSRTFTMNAGQTMTQVSDSIRIQAIPRSLYIFVRRNYDTQTYNQTDLFCAISNVNISFNNQPSLLATATPVQLYQIASANGYNRSFTESQNFTGLCLRCEMAKDIGLPSDLAPSVNAYGTIQVQCTFTSLSSITEDWNFMIMTATDGSLTISPNKAEFNTGYLTAQDVAVANAQDVKLTEGEYEQFIPKDQVMSGGRRSHMKKMKHVRQLHHKLKSHRKGGEGGDGGAYSGGMSADAYQSGQEYGGALVRYGSIPNNIASGIEEISFDDESESGGARHRKKKSVRPSFMKNKSRG